MKILVPVDGSKYSRAAADFIASRATLIGTSPEVELLHVHLPVPVRAARLIGKEAVTSYYGDESKKALKGSLSTLKRAGLPASSGYAIGHPADEIARRADDTDVDLIAMGSHGHGALASLLLGSVTLGVLGRTRKPLLLLRGHGPAPGDSLKVGIAVDGSDYGITAAKYVLKHRALFGERPQFTVIHAVPDFAGSAMPDMAGIALPAYSAEEVKAMQQQAFDKAVVSVRALFDAAGVSADTVCLTGPAGDEIAAYAKKKKLDLLVMGSHGYGAVKAAVLGSVAQRVAAHCATPLLLIREA
jgi:nucleotide-binding universal stress UspA family protein